MALIILSYVPSIPNLLGVVLLDFIEWFSASIEMVKQILSFIPLIWHIRSIDLHILSYPYLPRINPMWIYFYYRTLNDSFQLNKALWHEDCFHTQIHLLEAEIPLTVLTSLNK